MNETYADKWLKPMTHQSSYWNRCYRATVNGRCSSTFHLNCDGKGPTVTIIRVGKYILGGYTSLYGQVVSDMMDFILSQATQAQAVSER